jgi:hypothetical protein
MTSILSKLLRQGRGILMTLLLASATTHADVSGPQRAEVAHLLEFVRTTNCTIDRNGSLHDGPAAQAHILKKYDYFRDRIATTEDFIAYSAARSTISNQAYTVLCPGQPRMQTAEWLRQELERYRKKQAISY